MDQHENVFNNDFTYWEYRGFLIGRAYNPTEDTVLYEAVRPFNGKNTPSELWSWSRAFMAVDAENVVYGVHQSVLDWITRWSEENHTINDELGILKPLDYREKYSKWEEAMRIDARY